MSKRQNFALLDGRPGMSAIRVHVDRWNEELPDHMKLEVLQQEKSPDPSKTPGVVVEIIRDDDLSRVDTHRALWYLCCENDDQNTPDKPAILVVPAVKDGAPLRCGDPKGFHWTPLKDSVEAVRDDAIRAKITEIWDAYSKGKFSICCFRNEDDSLLAHFDACQRIFHDVKPPGVKRNQWRVMPLTRPPGDAAWNVEMEIQHRLKGMEGTMVGHIFYCKEPSTNPSTARALDDAAANLTASHPGTDPNRRWRRYDIRMGQGVAYCLQEPRRPERPTKKTWTLRGRVSP